MVCVGDLLEDIVIRQRTGLVRGTDNAVRITRSRGGSAANVAAFAAVFRPSRFIGRVGDDEIGRTLTGQLQKAGVDVRVQRAGRTGTVIVLVDELAERTMFPDRGAAAELQVVPDDWLAGAGLLHVTAYALVEPASADAVQRMAQVARTYGAQVSLDASSTAAIIAMGDRWHTQLEALSPDYFFANRDEADLVPVGAVTDLGGWYIAKRGEAPVEIHLPGAKSLRVDSSPWAPSSTPPEPVTRSPRDSSRPDWAVRIQRDVPRWAITSPPMCCCGPAPARTSGATREPE